MNSTLRRTSTYSFSAVVSSPGVALDAMLDHIAGSADASITGRYTQGDQAVVMFRCASDDEIATAIAKRLLDLLPDVTSATLHTGLGVNRRLAAEF